MSEALRALGIEVAAVAGGLVEVRGGDQDWLRSVLVTLGHTARAEGSVLRIPSRDCAAVERVVRAAAAPEAVVFDLDGVLADLARRTVLADVEDVRAMAAQRPLGVVTTCPRRLAESVLERHGFREFVGSVISSDDGPCKPNAFPVRLALQQLGVESAWMLGDNPSDVTAARGAGVVPLAIAPRGIGADGHADRLRAAGAVRLVADVGALRRLLE